MRHSWEWLEASKWDSCSHMNDILLLPRNLDEGSKGFIVFAKYFPCCTYISALTFCYPRFRVPFSHPTKSKLSNAADCSNEIIASLISQLHSRDSLKMELNLAEVLQLAMHKGVSTQTRYFAQAC